MSDEQQPVAWAAVWPDNGVDCSWIYDSREDAEWAAAGGDLLDGRRGVGTVVPLYRVPKPTLTDAEREAIQNAIGWIESPSADSEAMPEDYLPITNTLRGLLERTK